jgi:hypothetical protein
MLVQQRTSEWALHPSQPITAQAKMRWKRPEPHRMPRRLRFGAQAARMTGRRMIHAPDVTWTRCSAGLAFESLTDTVRMPLS